MGQEKEKILLELMEKQRNEVQNECDKFYKNGILEEFLISSEKNTIGELLMKAQALGTAISEPLAQEQLEKSCFQIRENVKQGKADNIEIRFDKMVQLFERKKHPLWRTLIKIWAWGDNTEPKCIFIKEDSTLDLQVFIGGENAVAIMATRNKSGDVVYTRLSEFHLLSICERKDLQKEVGLVTSYSWLTARIFSSVILALNLDPIRNLILSDYLESEWKQAQENSGQASDKEIGGEGDE